MKKITTVFCLLVCAGCTTARSSERPAASANDRVTPSEAQPRAYQSPAQTPTAHDDVTPTDTEAALGDRPIDTATSTSRPDELDRVVQPAPISDHASNTPRAKPISDAPKAHSAASSDRSSNADNTGINKRDRSPAALTPMDQGSTASDTKITQHVREAIIADGSLSFTAKNVKIITVNGKVTLRGPVNSAQERANIETKAMQVAGNGHVDNQTEIAK